MPMFSAPSLQLISVNPAIFLYLSASSLYSTSLTLYLPWYNRTGWLGIKHQVTSLLFPVAIFYSVLIWCRCVLFSLGRCRIHSLVSFFSLGLFFGLRVFWGSVLSNLQGWFDMLSFCVCFFRVCSKAFIALVILLISTIQRVHFSSFSWGFSFWFCSF